jgi:hypothetical protein
MSAKKPDTWAEFMPIESFPLSAFSSHILNRMSSAKLNKRPRRRQFNASDRAKVTAMKFFRSKSRRIGGDSKSFSIRAASSSRHFLFTAARAAALSLTAPVRMGAFHPCRRRRGFRRTGK